MFQTLQVSQQKNEAVHLFKDRYNLLWPACSAFSFLFLLAVLALTETCVNFNQQQDKRGPATEWGVHYLEPFVSGRPGNILKGTENSKSVIRKLPSSCKRRAKKITKSHV